MADGQGHKVLKAIEKLPAFNFSYEEKREEQYRRRAAFAMGGRWIVGEGRGDDPRVEERADFPTDNLVLIDLNDPADGKLRPHPLIVLGPGGIVLPDFGLGSGPYPSARRRAQCTEPAQRSFENDDAKVAGSCT